MRVSEVSCHCSRKCVSGFTAVREVGSAMGTTGKDDLINVASSPCPGNKASIDMALNIHLLLCLVVCR